MMKKILTMLVMCLAAVAMAEYTIELQDDMKIRLGGDIRARYEGYTFNVAAPAAIPRNTSASAHGCGARSTSGRM